VAPSTAAIAIALVAGMAAAVQVSVNGALGRRIGVLEATGLSVLLTTLIVLAVVTIAGRGPGGVAEGFRHPPWLWLGGLMGAIIVSSITFAGPRIGTFATVALLIAGQLVVALLIDSFGLLGADRIPATATRLAGLALLIAGALLVLRR